MILFRADTATLTDLERHTPRHNVARRQVLRRWGIPIHEPLSLAVEQITSLTAGSLGDEASGAVDTGRVELDELQVLIWEAGAGDHRHSITGASVRGSAREKGASVTAGGEDGLVRAEAVEGAVFLVIGDHSDTCAVLHKEVEDEEFDEVVCIVPERLAVESVQQGMAGSAFVSEIHAKDIIAPKIRNVPVSGSTTPVRLFAHSELLRLAPESTLVDLSILRSRLTTKSVPPSTFRSRAMIFLKNTHKRASVILQLNDTRGRLPCHIMDRILVT